MLSWVEHEKSFIISGPDCAEAQADLSLRCPQESEEMFFHTEAPNWDKVSRPVGSVTLISFFIPSLYEMLF